MFGVFINFSHVPDFNLIWKSHNNTWRKMEIDIDMWFQQNGATWHTANEKLNLFRKKFADRIISLNSAVN